MISAILIEDRITIECVTGSAWQLRPDKKTFGDWFETIGQTKMLQCVRSRVSGPFRSGQRFQSQFDLPAFMTRFYLLVQDSRGAIAKS